MQHQVIHHDNPQKNTSMAQDGHGCKQQHIGNEKLSKKRYGNHKQIRQAINNSVFEFQLLGYNLNFIPTPKRHLSIISPKN